MMRVVFIAVFLSVFGLSAASGIVPYNHTSCLLMSMDASISINSSTVVATRENIGSVPDAECAANNTATITIGFQENTTLTLEFQQLNGTVFLTQLTVNFRDDGGQMADSTLSEKLSREDAFYVCNKTRTYPLESSVDGMKIELTVKYFKVQAFGVTNGKYSTKSEVCRDAPPSTTAIPGTTTQPGTTSSHITTSKLPVTTAATNSPTPTPNNSSTPTPNNSSTPTPNNSTTSSRPKTTPSLPTTMKPAPSTTTAPSRDVTYSVSVKGVTCIVAKFKGTLFIPFTTGSTKKEGNFTYHITGYQNVTGTCGSSMQTLVATFQKDWKLTLTFTKPSKASATRRLLASDEDYRMSELSFTYNDEDIPGSAKGGVHNVSVQLHDQYKAKVDETYKCASLQILKMENVTFDVQHLKVQAFRKTNDTNFASGESTCPADNDISSNIVPIVVGVVLALLVVVIIIAYLIGRRRNRSGYQSV